MSDSEDQDPDRPGDKPSQPGHQEAQEPQDSDVEVEVAPEEAPEEERDAARSPGGTQARKAGESSSESRGGSSLFSWLQSRTVRRGVFVDPARDNFRTMTNLYCSMNPAVDSVNLSTQTHGAVFNLEYSPDG